MFSVLKSLQIAQNCYNGINDINIVNKKHEQKGESINNGNDTVSEKQKKNERQ